MAKPRTARAYGDDVTAASRVGLAEIMTVLGSYRDALVLIGGWVPYIILETFGAAVTYGKFIHVGSIDIDLVVDPSIIDEERYATIVQLLLDHGYEPVADSRYQFERMIRSPRSAQAYPIRVDFLTPKPLPGHGRKHRHRRLHDDPRSPPTPRLRSRRTPPPGTRYGGAPRRG